MNLRVPATVLSFAMVSCHGCHDDHPYVPYTIDDRLVRGFDYYTRTTFEFAADALDAAQNGIGGGGRYDGLVEVLGGDSTPGIGFGIGIERVLLTCDAEGVFSTEAAVITW